MSKYILQSLPPDPRLRRRAEIEEERIEAAIAHEGGCYTPPTFGLHGDKGPLECVDLSSQQADPLWLVDGLFQRDSLMLIGGPPGGGKTWFAMGLSKALVLGEPFLGYSVEDRNKVLYLDFENGDSLLHQRFSRLGVPRYFQDALHVAPLERKITDRACWETVRREVDIFEPDLVVIDTFASAASVDENDVRAVEEFYETVWEPLRRRGTSLMLLHHTRKHSPGERGIDRFRGSTHIVGRVDRALLIDPGKSGGIVVTDVKARQHAEVPKMHVVLTAPAGHPNGVMLALNVPPPPAVRAPKRNVPSQILMALSAGPLRAREIATALGLSRTAVNNHLPVLVSAGDVVKTGWTYALP